MTNYIGFLVPNSTLLCDTLRLTELEKSIVQAELISKNEYVRVLEFTSGSVITVSIGVKDEYRALKEAGLIR